MSFLVDKKVLIYWRFTAAVLIAAVFSLFIIILPLSFLWTVGLLAVFLCVLLLTEVWLLPMYFKATALSVDGGKIVLKKGVLIKREYIFPNTKNVYIQVFKLPLASCFGLRYLVVRGVGHSLGLPPLTEYEAKRFKRAVQGVE